MDIPVEENKIAIPMRTVIVVAVIVVSVIVFLIWDGSKLFGNKTTDNSISDNTAASVSIVPTGDQGTTPVPSVAPTGLPAGYLNSDGQLNYQKMLSAGNADALEIIDYAFAQIANINSIGYKYTSSDGQGYDSIDTYKFAVDPANIRVDYSFDSSSQYDSGVQDQRHAQESGTVSNPGDTIDLLRSELTTIVFQSSTTDSSSNQVNDTTFIAQNNVASWGFKANDATLGNGTKAVKYTFSGVAPTGGLTPLYEITIGTDGRIYFLLLPNIDAYTQYSEFEYNKTYSLKPVERYKFDTSNFQIK